MYDTNRVLPAVTIHYMQRPLILLWKSAARALFLWAQIIL